MYQPSELGHNWGATHDDESLECSPPYSEGGSYIMNTYSVSGYDDNNDVGWLLFEIDLWAKIHCLNFFSVSRLVRNEW